MSASRKFIRQLHSSVARHRTVVETAQLWQTSNLVLDAFRQRAFAVEKPYLFRKNIYSPASSLPIIRKWFSESLSVNSISPYLAKFAEWPFPYELMCSSPEKHFAITRFRDWLMDSKNLPDQILAGILQSPLSEPTARQFYQICAPLDLLAKALEFNTLQGDRPENMIELYIAQCPLTDIPTELRDDLTTPPLILAAGKGDIYSSSIWLGTEPTYTPLHRDPNPNLFCQLHSKKLIRLLPPQLGEETFFKVQVRIRQQANSRIRTTDMMEGKERQALHDEIWNDEDLIPELCEVELVPGDALFIPQGWWHSVKSVATCGKLNGSINWWFR